MKKHNLLLFTMTALLVSTPALHAADFADFEPPTFVAGDGIAGNGGFESFLSGEDGVITPDPLGSGVDTVLDGTQSALVGASGQVLLYKDFDGMTLTPDLTVSTEIEGINEGSGGSFLYFSNNTSTGQTDAGIGFNSGVFQTYSASGPVYGDVRMTQGDVYELTLSIDQTAGTFQAFEQDLTADTPEVAFGTFNLDDGPLDPSEVSTNGGLFITSTGTDAEAVYDDLTVTDASAIPEPSSMALILAGFLSLGFLRGKRHLLGLR